MNICLFLFVGVFFLLIPHQIPNQKDLFDNNYKGKKENTKNAKYGGGNKKDQREEGEEKKREKKGGYRAKYQRG